MQKQTIIPEEMLKVAIQAALDAGREIMKHYDSPLTVEIKEDNSPLTIADRRAHAIIEKALKNTAIPVLSEEGRHFTYETRKDLQYLWIVDPLDGTKEFIKHNGEFTVNIALIERHKPVLGVIYCPPLKTLYFGSAYQEKAYKILLEKEPINVDNLLPGAIQLPLTHTKRPFTVVASKSHLNRETADYIEQVRKKQGEIDLVPKGSSLKFCLLAEGTADLYPRFAPTCEWDTAAAQAILETTGGEVVSVDNFTSLQYNKENLYNPGFIARRNKSNVSIKNES